MKTTLHRADSRGSVDHGWLKAKHSFSFGSYQNADRMNFGLLRVINDDIISPGKGFDTHPHKDMEIVTIPLSGSLKHKDSVGNEAVIKSGEVQLMSAGKGVFHSEFNNSLKDYINLLQIWVMPEKIGILPRYDQKSFDINERKNKWQVVVNPIDTDDGGLKINQQAWFSLLDMDNNNEIIYTTHQPHSGVYFFTIEGQVIIGNENLHKRDAIGIEGTSKIALKSKSELKLLAIEVPME